MNHIIMIKAKLTTLLNNRQNANLLIYGLGQAFNLITPLLVVPHIVGICGIANYGKISIGMAISFFIMVFIDYGSDIIGVKDVAVKREKLPELEEIFLTTFASKFVLLSGVLFVFSMLIWLVPFFNTEKELFFLGLPILVGQFINPTWFLQGIENFKWITILTILSKLIYLFGIFFFIGTTGDYVFVNLWWGVGTIAANGFAFVYVYRKYGFSFRKIQKQAVVKLLCENFPMFFSQIFVSLQMYAPIMLIGIFGNNLMAGQYKIVEQIIVIFKTYIYLFFNFVYPRVCFLWEQSVKEALKFWKTFNGLNFIFIAFSMAAIYLFSGWCTSYFTKTNIVEISSLLQVAVLIPLLLTISIPLKQLLLGDNQQKLYVRITMVMVIVNLLAMVLLLPKYQIYGVLLTLIVTEVLTIAVYFWNLRSKINA